MKLRVNKEEVGALKGKAIFVDSDFLGVLYSDEEIFEETLKTLPGNLYIDPFVRFEFLRDVTDLQKRINKQTFLNGKVFNPAISHPELYIKVRDIAINLSYIYASQNKAKGVSIVDLMLAAQLIRSPNDSIILTGNRKDYPSIIFDAVTILNYEPKDDNVRSITALKLNKDNYEYHKQNLENIEEKFSREIKVGIEKKLNK